MGTSYYKLYIEKATLKELDNHETLFQSGFWGKLKESYGQTPLPFLCRLETESKESGTIPLLVMLRRIAPGFSLAYVPHGPVLSGIRLKGTFSEINSVYGFRVIESNNGFPEKLLESLAGEIAHLMPGGTIFIRFDVPWGIIGAGKEAPALGVPFRKAPMDIQPPSTVLVDLTVTEEEILARMKSKTRYNIRLAFRKGVNVTEEGAGGIETWYRLYRETAQRDRIVIHSREYYKRLFKLADEYGEGAPVLKLLIARVEDEPVAGIVLSIKGRVATYLYGASSEKRRNFMPAYALQWEAMKIAKARGCKVYDLFGIPPKADLSHSMHGLYRFKTGFGGSVFHRPGCWDFPLKKTLYPLYCAAEGLRRYYYRDFRKRNTGS